MEPGVVNILLVEDNPAHAELVTRGLEENRGAIAIHHVSDGEAALDFLLRRGSFSDPNTSPRPEVVLLDLRIPKIDGLEVLRTIKSTAGLRQIPVVVLTTSASEPDVSRAYDLHANSYLVKPVDYAHFTRLMHQLGFYWLEWNHPPKE
jgi:CheY-like chemotaxis protein